MEVKNSEKFNFPISTLVGSSVLNFIRVWAGKPVDLKYLPRFILSFLAALILDPIGKIENMISRGKIRKAPPIQSPVFIIGFWRSGTTFLHNLLCHDRQFAYVSTYQGIFPHHVFWNKRWLEKIIRLLMPDRRPVDRVKLDLDYPQEEEIALGNLQPLSFYHFFYFPRSFDTFYDQSLMFKNVSPGSAASWEKQYQLLIRKSMIKTGGDVFLSKCPANTFRIRRLLEIFPDARFIYLYRNPYSVLSSYKLFMSQVIRAIGFQKIDEATFNQKIFKLFTGMTRAYEKTKPFIPDEHLMEVRYETFKQDPLKILEAIYLKFGLSGYEQIRPEFERLVVENNNHTSSNYSIDPAMKAYINQELRDYLQASNYPVQPD